MTTVNSAGAATSLRCECGHPKALHHDGFDDCSECDCIEFRKEGSRLILANGLTAHVDSLATTAPDPQPAATTKSRIDRLLTEAERSDSKRIRSLGQKITALVVDLEERLAFDGERAKAAADVARLERQLAEAKAKLRGKASASASPPGAFQCAACSKTVNSAQGLATHVTRVHKVAS